MSSFPNPAVLARGLAALETRSSGVERSDLLAALPVIVGEAVRTSKNHELAVALRSVTRNILALSTVLWRHLEHCSRDEESIDEHAWTSFAEADIFGFHVQLRSLFDEIASLIAWSAATPGQLPPSFTSLREKLGKYERKLPPPVVQVVRDADWYDIVRTMRDSIIHDGAELGVFRLAKRPLFRILKADGNLARLPDAFAVRGWTEFDYYAGTFTGYTLALVDLVCGVILDENYGGKRAGQGELVHRSFGAASSLVCYARDRASGLRFEDARPRWPLTV